MIKTDTLPEVPGPETSGAEPATETLRVLNWQDQDDQLRDLWARNQAPNVIAEQLGRSVASIMTRAVRLGLPRRTAPGRKPGRRLNEDGRSTAVATTMRARVPVESMDHNPGQAAMRICLMCLNKFPSAGRQNRICSSCRGSPEYAAGSSIPDISFKVEV